MTKYLLPLYLLFLTQTGVWAQRPMMAKKPSPHSQYIKALTSGMTAFYDAESKKEYMQAIHLLDRAYTYNPNDYLSQDFRAQALLALGDSAAAYTSIHQAIDNYHSHPPATPDLLIGYGYLRKAILERFYLKDIDLSLASLQKGKFVLNEEFIRLQNLRADKSAYTYRFEQVQRDLQNFEIDILLHSSKKFTKAIARKEEELLTDPNNYLLLVSYAQLHETYHPGKAKFIYQKATQMEPNNIYAWYNLALMEYNQGILLGQKAITEMDFYESKALEDKAHSYYASAIPYFEKVLTLFPCDRSALLALQNIISILNDSNQLKSSACKKYKTILEECE